MKCFMAVLMVAIKCRVITLKAQGNLKSSLDRRVKENKQYFSLVWSFIPFWCFEESGIWIE